MLKSTGHEEISLSSLSSSDYSQLKGLVNFLIEEFKGKGINNFSAIPQNRCVLTGCHEQSAGYQKEQSDLCTGGRLLKDFRDVINKGLTEEIILEGAGQAF